MEPDHQDGPEDYTIVMHHAVYYPDGRLYGVFRYHTDSMTHANKLQTAPQPVSILRTADGKYHMLARPNPVLIDTPMPEELYLR